MDYIMTKLRSIGVFLAAAGALSIVLSFLNYNLRILMWIDMWGETVGWAIRIGLIVVGLIILGLGSVLSPKK